MRGTAEKILGILSDCCVAEDGLHASETPCSVTCFPLSSPSLQQTRSAQHTDLFEMSMVRPYCVITMCSHLLHITFISVVL